MKQHVYIIGSKGIPARYGGYETFVDQLTAGQKNRNIEYHVSSRSDNSELSRKERQFKYHNANVYSVDVPQVGPAQAIVYDIESLRYAIRDAREHRYLNPIFYILACRIGPFMSHYVRQIHHLNGTYYINPDGHEWKRAKWSWPVRMYWKHSERLMIKHADLVICDNRKIEEYINSEYKSYSPNTTFIAYGTGLTPSGLRNTDDTPAGWLSKHSVSTNEYYLIVGRFVPENNYETMIREFIRSNTSKDLVIVTNVEKNKFYQRLNKATKFESDPRIKFVGTVYDQQLLKFIRENAYGYIHGHEVGGTNPSLLEALSSTPVNLLIDVGFNRDVARDSALYWDKTPGSLAATIQNADHLSSNTVGALQIKAREIIRQEYTWPIIISKYEALFANA